MYHDDYAVVGQVIRATETDKPPEDTKDTKISSFDVRYVR